MGIKSTAQPAQQAALTPTETTPEAQTPSAASQPTATPAPAAQSAAAPAPAAQQTQTLARTGNGHGNPLVLPESGTWVVGMENLGAEDITLPYIRLAQAVSDDVHEGRARPGDFIHSITDEKLAQPLEFIPIAVSITRARFVDRSRLCFSVDGITGQGDPGGVCASCPHAQWATDAATGKRIAPACPKGYQYIVVIPGADIGPVALILTKTSAPAAKRLNFFIRSAPAGSTFILKAKAEKGASGPYYRFEVEKGRALTPEEAQAILRARHMLAGKQVVVEQDASDFTWDAAADAPGDGESPF